MTAERPAFRAQRWLLALMVLSIASVDSSRRTGQAMSQVPQTWSAGTAVTLSCPPDPCVPGNQVGRDFFVQVVEQLSDVPPSDFAVDALVAWEPWENTLACWNPLATCWQMDEVCYFNPPACVQHYQNQEMGVQATANTLNLGYYNAIRSMLRMEAFDREGLRAALDTWGTCAGSGCDPLLDTWKDLWDAYGGGGCHCCWQLAASNEPDAWTALARTAPSPVSSAVLATTLPVVPQPIIATTPTDVLIAPSAPPTGTLPVVPAWLKEPPTTPPEDPPPALSEANVAVIALQPVDPLRVPPASVHYLIPKSVFGSGGGPKTSAHYTMNGTQGQTTDLNRRQSANYAMAPGYWGQWALITFEYGVFLPLVTRSH